MAFVQIIECRTSEFDKIQQLEEEWRAATEGKRTLRRSIVAETAPTQTGTLSSPSLTLMRMQ